MAEVVRAPGLNELRGRKSAKWRFFPSDVLPLPVAEMDFPIAEPIKNEKNIFPLFCSMIIIF